MYGTNRILIASKIPIEDVEKRFNELGFHQFQMFIQDSPDISYVRVKQIGVGNASNY